MTNVVYCGQKRIRRCSLAIGRKTGGRRKGTANRKNALTRAGVEALCATYGYNPWEAMILMAQNPDTDDTTRFQCHKEIAQFILSKLRAVELSGDQEHPIRLDIFTTLRQALERAYESRTAPPVHLVPTKGR